MCDLQIVKTRTVDGEAGVPRPVNCGFSVKCDRDSAVGDATVAAQDLQETEGPNDARKFAAERGLVFGKPRGEVAAQRAVGERVTVGARRHDKGGGAPLDVVGM